MKATWLLAALASVAFVALPASSPNAAPLAPGALGASLKVLPMNWPPLSDTPHSTSERPNEQLSNKDEKESRS